jgi:hypothetical protein
MPIKQLEIGQKALWDEVQGGYHWFALSPGGKEYLVTDQTRQLAKARGITDETLEFMRRVKNDFLYALNEMEQALAEGIRNHYKTDSVMQQTKLEILRAMFEQHRSKPYLPESRFGEYTLTMYAGKGGTMNGKTVKKGATIYFRTFDSESARNKAEKVLRAANPQHSVSAGILPERTALAIGALPVNAVVHFADVLEERGYGLSVEQLEILKDVTFEATSYGRVQKFFTIPRKAIPGASRDLRRVYSDYMWKSANAISKLWFGPEFNRITKEFKSAIQKAARTGQNVEQPQMIFDRMKWQVDYVMLPQHEWNQLRAFASLWYLYGSAKTALMNFTTVPVMTYPHLAGRFGDPAAFGAISRAMKLAVQAYTNFEKFQKENPQLAQLLERGLQDGIRNQSFAATLAGASDANALENLLPFVDFEHPKARLVHDSIRKATWRTIDVGMLPFRVMEYYNRDITLIASFDLDIKAGRDFETAYANAVDAVDKTQNEYSPWNRPKLLTGKKSAALLFFSIVQNCTFFMFGGDKGWWRSLLILAALGGLKGLPFMENLMDMLNYAGRKLFGEYVDLRKEAKDFAESFGANPDLIWSGLSRLTPWDVSSSIGFGRPIPGTEAMFGTGTFENRMVQATAEVGGPIGSLGVNTLRAMSDSQPNSLLWWDAVLPPLLRNIERGYVAATEGEVKTRRGDTILDDVTFMETVGLFGGFTPTRKMEVQEPLRAAKEALAYWQERKKNLTAKLFVALESEDETTIESIAGDIEDYNKKAPPGLELDADGIKRSMKTRARYAAETEEGIPATRSRASIFESYGVGAR